jgi:mannose-6-phosphate isomerase-like protein (cupin superfamily)
MPLSAFVHKLRDIEDGTSFADALPLAQLVHARLAAYAWIMSAKATPHTAGAAEVQLPCEDLAASLEFFGALGFRIETIFPADDPRVASLFGHGLRIRLAPGGEAPGLIRLPIEAWQGAGERPAAAPNGTRIEFFETDAPPVIPPLQPAFLISRFDAKASNPGRAGMLYRDLIPGRLGGRYIASHIVVPDGGPVADWVHYHRVRVQFLVCRRGRARLVYEDQGEPFLFEAGDCVLQPSLIRHRVLETSPGFEVVEVACPALHETLADHDLPLPNSRLDPERDFGGQRFLHSRAARTPWLPFGDAGFERRDTGLLTASAGLADAFVLRPAIARNFADSGHHSELLLGFVMEGSATLATEERNELGGGDAFIIPPGHGWGIERANPELRLLVISSPAA